MRRSTRRRVAAPASVNVCVDVEVVERRQLLSGTNGLEAVLTGPANALGKAEYKVKEGVRSFEVEVLRGAQGTYSVAVDGEVVGQIHVAATGLGSMELTDNPHDADEFHFPSNWPGVSAGSAVSIVGLASGTVAQSGNDDTVVTNLLAPMSGTGSQFATAKFEVELEHGVEEREFELQAYNLAPNADLPLVVNGVTVATVHTSALGTVRVKYSDKTRPDAVAFPASFPDVSAGMTVAIGTQAAGTFQARGDDSSTTSGDHLRIALTSTGTASATAEYETRRGTDGSLTHEEFKVEVWNGVSGTSLTVRVGGIMVGQLVVGSRGYGRLDFESGDDSKPFPSGWPGVSSGTVVEVGSELSGAFSGSGRTADPSNSNSDDAYRIDRSLGLSRSGGLFENFGGRGEKWVRGKGREWYFLTPDGALYKWDGGAGARGSLVTILDPAFHADPSLLFEAKGVRNLSLDDDLLKATAAELDSELQLRSSASQFEDWGGKGEKWFRGGTDDWYFVTPDGSLMKWDRHGRATGALVGSFDSRFHEDTSLLTDGVTKLSDDSRAFSLDHGLGLVHPPNEFFNWGGRQEKWLQGDDGWYYITPDGGFHRWNRSAGANGTRLTTMARRFYDDTSLLSSSSAVGSSVSQSVLDDVFVDSSLLF